jgi:hypothetical protein
VICRANPAKPSVNFSASLASPQNSASLAQGILEKANKHRFWLKNWACEKPEQNPIKG